MIRTARPDEARMLSDLALESKAHWGYDAEFLEACRDELTYAPDDCDRIRVEERDGRVVGMCLTTGDPPVGVLDALYVEPAVIGKGVGRDLLNDAVARSRRAGFSALELDADPCAEPFYRHHGAVQVGESPSGSIPGRMLPRLRLALAQTDAGSA